MDEFHRLISLMAVGSGLRFSTAPASRQALTLRRATSFDRGIVGLHYAALAAS